MITLWCAALIKMRFSTSSLLTTIIVFSVFYIFSEYRESKQNKSSLASMKVVDKDNNIKPKDSYSDDIYAYKSWSREKINKFLEIKAAQYEQRGARVDQYCNLQVEYENMILSNPGPKPCPPRPNPNPKTKEVKNPKSNWDWGDTKIP